MTNADLKKFLPERLANVIGKNMPAIINAFNQGSSTVEQTVQACIDQLFISTASGRYLITLGEEGGFAIPPNSSLDIRAFRILVPIMVSNPKQVRISINDLVQSFYGSDRTKANISATVFGPYSLSSGDDLMVETDAGSFSVNILASQVSDINAVSATELASIINYSQSIVLADAVLDRTTGLEKIRLISKTQGTSSSIRISGGKLQNVLKFDKLSDTNITNGLVFNVTKTSTQSDEILITWDGVGTNPQLYNVNKDDVFTIRGLVDVGPNEFSFLNGSYTILDSGFDYVKIRNTLYTDLSASLTLSDADSFRFTKYDRSTLFDLSEYAFSSEIEDQTITVTVPAVPPLTLRFLGGSAHLQGGELNIIDFSRTYVQFELPGGVDAPVDVNQFLIANDHIRYDFATPRYETYISDGDTNVPIYQISPFESDNTVFPYTTSTSIGSNSVYATVDSPFIRIKFPFPHGLYKGWGFNLSVSSGAGNYLLADLNDEHVVKTVLSATEVLTTIKTSTGAPKLFSGFNFGPVDVYRHSLMQADGSDFYLDYPSSAALLADGFSVGDVFKFDPLQGTDIHPFYAGELKYKKLAVTSITNTGLIHRVNFTAGFGPGGSGLIIQSAEGFRSGYLGGASTYYLDKLSVHNEEAVFPGLKAVFLNVTKSANEGYVGSFVFDSQGEKTGVTVSQNTANLTDNILKGEALSVLQVDSLTTNGDFPTSGKIVIGYGTNRYEGPITFFATIDNLSSKQIVIDPAYKFKFSHPIGDKVQFIHSIQPYTPGKFGTDFPVYVTGTTQARDAMFILIKELVAAGIFIEEEVILPDLRYDDSMIQVFD